MTGTELWVIRDWLIERVKESTTLSDNVHPLTCVIVDILNEEIKENFLTVLIDKTILSGYDKTVAGDSSIADCVRHGKKIQVIKTIGEIFKWGLKESKDFADSHWDAWLAKVKV